MGINQTFSPEILAQLPVFRLRKIAEYYGIKLPTKAKKQELLDILLEEFSPLNAEIPPSQQPVPPLLPDETPDNPKYSVRVRRAKWAELEKHS